MWRRVFRRARRRARSLRSQPNRGRGLLPPRSDHPGWASRNGGGRVPGATRSVPDRDGRRRPWASQPLIISQRNGDAALLAHRFRTAVLGIEGEHRQADPACSLELGSLAVQASDDHQPVSAHRDISRGDGSSRRHGSLCQAATTKREPETACRSMASQSQAMPRPGSKLGIAWPSSIIMPRSVSVSS